MSRSKPPSLVEGVDYYMDGSRFVFTAAYHQKRGYCCNSKCRHCPYAREAAPFASIEFVGLSLKPPGRTG
jgi:hypothetical protein